MILFFHSKVLFTELFSHDPVFSFKGILHYSLFGLWSSLTNAVADAVAVVPFSPEVLIETIWSTTLSLVTLLAVFVLFPVPDIFSSVFAEGSFASPVVVLAIASALVSTSASTLASALASTLASALALALALALVSTLAPALALTLASSLASTLPSVEVVWSVRSVWSAVNILAPIPVPAPQLALY